MKKDSNSNQFVRYGTLVPQYHDISERWEHTAPVEWGFYAFPVGYVEPFLLGGVGSGSLQNGRYSYLKDESGKRIVGHWDDFYEEKVSDEYWGIKEHVWKENWKDYFKRRKIKERSCRLWVLKSEDMEQSKMTENATGYEDVLEYAIVIENKPRKFTYNGNIWHHFTDAPDEWKLTNPRDVIRRVGSWVETDMQTYRKALEKYVRMCRYNAQIRTDHKMSPGPSSGVPIRFIDKDWCEVFIEHL